LLPFLYSFSEKFLQEVNAWAKAEGMCL
jgi:hypothetical protein